TPNQPTAIAVNVVGVQSGTPQPGTGTVSYRIGSSGSFITVPMTQGAANQYTAILPAAPCPSDIQYYFSAQSTGAETVSDPFDAPALQFSAIVANGSTTVANLDMN